MRTIGGGALVVSLGMMVLGVYAGLTGDHRAAIPALVLSFLALGVGIILLRD